MSPVLLKSHIFLYSGTKLKISSDISGYYHRNAFSNDLHLPLNANRLAHHQTTHEKDWHLVMKVSLPGCVGQTPLWLNHLGFNKAQRVLQQGSRSGRLPVPKAAQVGRYLLSVAAGLPAGRWSTRPEAGLGKKKRSASCEIAVFWFIKRINPSEMNHNRKAPSPRASYEVKILQVAAIGAVCSLVAGPSLGFLGCCGGGRPVACASLTCMPSAKVCIHPVLLLRTIRLLMGRNRGRL